MLFVYVHIIWVGCWIGFGAEDYPYGLLTMIVSLEAIFLECRRYAEERFAPERMVADYVAAYRAAIAASRG